MRALEIRVQDIDHSGIVAGIIDQMGLVEQINRQLGTHPQEQLSNGQVVKAMILNGLGFVTAPLYLFEHYFVGKATEHLIGEGVCPEHLNDDRLGRVLDKLYAAGLTQLFVQIALKAAKQFGVEHQSVHLDSTSIAVDGEYAGAQAEDQGEPAAIVINRGYSRDHRPDLKQFVVDLMCSGDGDVPLYLRVADGNESDKAVFARLMEQFRAQWQLDVLFVADSALYSQENLQALRQLQWLSRVPATLADAQQLLQQTPDEQFKDTQLAGYRIAPQRTHYGEVEQRWLLIESQKRQAADLDRLQQQIEQQQLLGQKQLRQLCRQRFACAEDARQAAEQWAAQLHYHSLATLEILEEHRCTRAGRPRRGDPPEQLSYRLQATLQLNQAAVATATRRAGRFILATNVLDEARWSDDELLAEYKAQQSSERGFRFLKDPLFFTSSVFLKSPERVAALAMVMGLCLLVYTLGQRALRQALEAAKERVKNQLKKPTQRPTLRWIFQCFQSIHVVSVGNLKQIANLTEERRWILQFLGAPCQKYYLLV